MANEVKVTITAEDKTKAGIHKANASLKQMVDGARKVASGFAQAGAAAVAVAVVIDRAFKAANEAALRLGRTDVSTQYEKMNTALQSSLDTILLVTGTLDGMKAAWYGIEQAAKLAALLIIKGMAEAQIAVLNVGGAFSDLQAQIRTVALAMLATRMLTKAEYDLITTSITLTDTQRAAAIAAIQLRAANQAAALVNGIVTESYKEGTKAIQDQRKALVGVTMARRAAQKGGTGEKDWARSILDIARSAAQAQADANKERARTLAEIDADSAAERVAMAEDYQEQIKSISKDGGEEIEDAIRGGDALALARALKSRQTQLATARTDYDKKLGAQKSAESKSRAAAQSAYSQAMADQKDAQTEQVLSLKLSLMTIETMQAASQAAQLLGIQQFFVDAADAFGKGWDALTGPKTGDKVGSKSGSRGGTPSTISNANSPSGKNNSGPLNVNVIVGGDDAVRAIVRNVFVQEMMTA